MLFAFWVKVGALKKESDRLLHWFLFFLHNVMKTAKYLRQNIFTVLIQIRAKMPALHPGIENSVIHLRTIFGPATEIFLPYPFKCTKKISSKAYAKVVWTKDFVRQEIKYQRAPLFSFLNFCWKSHDSSKKYPMNVLNFTDGADLGRFGLFTNKFSKLVYWLRD